MALTERVGQRFFRGGSSSYLTSSLASLYHTAREPQKMFWNGLVSGSESRVPAGTTTALPVFANQGSEEPQ